VCFVPQGSTKEEEGWKKMWKMCAPPPPSAHLPQLVKSILTLHFTAFLEFSFSPKMPKIQLAKFFFDFLFILLILHQINGFGKSEYENEEEDEGEGGRGGGQGGEEEE
jgi:hypothetical protein